MHPISHGRLLRASALALALSAGGMAHAALHSTLTLSDVQLTLTDASGVSLVQPLLQAEGDPGGRLSLLTVDKVNDLPVVLDTASVAGLPPGSQVGLETNPAWGSVSSLLIVQDDRLWMQTTSAVNDTPTLWDSNKEDAFSFFFSTDEQKGAVLAADAIVAQLDLENGGFIMLPIHGGIALPPGSTATLTGLFAAEAFLTPEPTPPDFGLVAHASISHIISFALIADGNTLEFASSVDAIQQIPDLSLTTMGVDNPFTANDRPDRFSATESFSISISNSSDQTQWLLPYAQQVGSIRQAVVSVPEPATVLTWGMGLVGLLAATRQRRVTQRCAGA